MTFMVRINAVSLTRLIFIMAGQSNMAGRGVLGELPAFAYGYKVKNFKNSGVWADAAEPIDDPAGQVDAVSEDISPGASPCLAFGNALAAIRPYNEIGLVPCAKGATALSEWEKSGLSRSTLYGSMVARANEAKAAGTLAGIIWYQGESDAADAGSVATWGSRFLDMIDDLRTDTSTPDLKVIVTELGPNSDPGTYTSWADLQAEQQALDGELSGDVACVSAADLGVKVGDTQHLTTASLVTLGERYAAAMQALLEA